MDNKEIFNKAKEYLLSFHEINEEILNNHLNEWKNKKPKDLKELFEKMCFHSQNRRDMPNSIGDINKISSFVYYWDYKQVNKNYDSWEKLFDTIESSKYTPP